jgi:hypothetical protein
MEENGSLVEWSWLDTNEVLADKPVPVHFAHKKMVHVFVLGLNSGLRVNRPAHLHVLYLINVNNEVAAAWRTIQAAAVHYQLFFENWHFVLSEDGTVVPKHVRDVLLTCVLIKTVH